MIVCPACSYPNDEHEHRCERCGRRFDAPRLRAGAHYEGDFFGLDERRPAAAEDFSQEVPDGDDLPPWGAEADPGECTPAIADLAPTPQPELRPAPAPPEWKGEISGRIRSFRQRRASQCSLPFDDLEAGQPEPATAPAPCASPLGVADAGLPPVSPPSPAEREKKVIPFEQIAARAAALKPAPTPIPHALASAEPQSVRQPGPAPGARNDPGSSERQNPHPAPPVARAPQGRGIPATGAPEGKKAPDRGKGESPAPRHVAARARGDGVPVEPVLQFPEPRRAPRPAAPPDSFIEVEVAPLAARAMAAVYDGAVLAAGAVVFLGAYTLVGGRFPLQRAGLAALAGSLGLVAAVFLLFCLYFSDCTPGLRWLSIRLVDFDGAPASRDHRLLRMLGMVMSALALGLGFLWALADEDGLTWHDRISRTCLTMSGSSFVVRTPRGL